LPQQFHLIQFPVTNPPPAVCKVPLADVQKKYAEATAEAKEHTQDDILLKRCYMINYQLVLLRDVYRFGRSDKKLFFIDEIDKKSLDWPLGAFVYTQVTGGLTSQAKAVQPATPGTGSATSESSETGGKDSTGTAITKVTDSNTSSKGTAGFMPKTIPKKAIVNREPDEPDDTDTWDLDLLEFIVIGVWASLIVIVI
jgi:hypothetical protein